MWIQIPCPTCGHKLRFYVDLNLGVTYDELGTECTECGAQPVWKFNWWITGELGDFLRDDAPKPPAAPTPLDHLRTSLDDLSAWVLDHCNSDAVMNYDAYAELSSRLVTLSTLADEIGSEQPKETSS